jgi:DNA replication protein DnaC
MNEFVITKEQVQELRESTIGIFCDNKCKGTGVIVEKQSKGVRFNDCACVKEFVWKSKLLSSNIPQKHWDFSFRALLKKFIEENNGSLALIKGYIDQIDKMIKEGVGLYIQGTYGLAKTALSSYIGKEFLKKDRNVYFIRMSQLTKLLFDSITIIEAKQKLNYIRKDVVLLIVDEIEKDYKIDDVKSFSGVYISDIFDDFYESKKCLIVTSNIMKSELSKVHSNNVVDRLQELVDIPLVGESYRGKVDKRSLILEGIK